MGTELQQAGLPAGVCLEAWCREHPHVVSRIHGAYLDAGAEVIYTCTFGANRPKLAEYRITDVTALNKTLAQIARQAAGKERLVMGDIGPTGRFIEPFGDLSFEDAVATFKEQALGLLAGGVDGFVIETMMEIQEARAALLAIKELGDYFTIVTMTFEKDGRTLNGTDPLSALVTLQSLGAHAVGCNCSTGPAEMIPWVSEMKRYATVPIVAKPNAGLPHLEGGVTHFSMDAETFGHYARALVGAGVNLVGGCCGTTPDHIRAAYRQTIGIQPQPPWRKSLGALSSHRSAFIFEDHRPITVVGERINPTGKKAFQQSLAEGSLSLVREFAKDQEAQGAHLLDINVGAPGIDEVSMLRGAVLAVAEVSPLPIVIDSPRIEALEQALRVYPGRALLNSIPGKEDKMTQLLPLAAKYGAMCILLPLTDRGIPATKKDRTVVIRSMLHAAKRQGFTKEDLVVDGLVMTVAAEPTAPTETLATLEWCHRVLGMKTILGISNVSFGMPERKWINAAFLVMAARAGLDLAIINPAAAEIMALKKAADVLTGRDLGERNTLPPLPLSPPAKSNGTIPPRIRKHVLPRPLLRAIGRGSSPPSHPY